MARNWKWRLGKDQQGTEDLSSADHKEMNPANITMSLEADPSPVEASDEIPVLANTLSYTLLRNPEAQGRAKPCPDAWSIKSVG